MQTITRLPFLLLISLLLIPTTAQANKAQHTGKINTPDWVVTFGKSQKYPASRYLVGFGSSTGKGSEASQIAQDNALADVSRTIVVNIKSLVSTAKEGTNQQFLQYVSSVTQSSTSIQLMGLQIEQYVDDSPINPTTYALAYASRAELNRIYDKKRTTLRDQIKRIIAGAQAAERNSRMAEAVTKYLSLYPLYEESKEAEMILLVAKQSSSIDAAFEELAGSNVSSEGQQPSLMSQTEVTNRLDQLLSQSMTSVDDVARAVVFQLSKQVRQPEGKILVTPFTYQDTKISSPFARYFRASLETQVGQMVKWNPVNQTSGFKPKSTQITRDLAKYSGAEWLLSGTYWEQGEKIKLMATMRDVNTGKALAGAEVLFDADLLKPLNLDFKPQNFSSALIEQKAFAEGEFISDQLQVEVWTNKGNENLLFTKGETMKVYVRVNRESHIRLLYILAGGQRTLLYDDLYIDQSKVNHVVEVPEEFECAPPFGAEMLVVVARTEKFEPLDTVKRNGYLFLKASTAKDAAAMVRGMKRKKQKANEIQQTEAKSIITTIE